MKRSLVLLVALVVGLIAIVVLLPRLMDAEAYRGEIIRRAEAALGRPVEISGPLWIALLPSPRIRAAGLRIAGSANSPSSTLAVKRVEIDLGWSILLGQGGAISRLYLIEPSLVIDQADPWWHAAIATESEPIQIEEILVENGQIGWRGDARKASYALANIDAKLTLTSNARGVRATGTAVSDGIPVAFEATLGGPVTDGRSPLAVRVTMRPDLARVVIRGSVAQSNKALPDFRGRIEIESANIATALSAAGLAAPAGAFSDIYRRPFALSGEFALERNRVSANALTLQLGDQRATGALSAVYDRTLFIDLAVAVSSLDLDRLAHQAQPQGTARNKASGPTATVARLSGAPPTRAWSLPTGLEGSIDLSIDALGLHGGTIRNFHATATLGRGIVVVSNAAARLPGETALSGLGQVSWADERPTIEGSIALQSDNLRGLLSWAGADTTKIAPGRLRRLEGKSSIEGTLDNLQFTNIDVRFDSTRLNGGVAYRAGARSAFGLDLRVDQLNLDDYFETGSPGTSRSVLSDFDANLRLQADSLIAGGLAVERVMLEGTLVDGALDLREFKLGALAGATLDARGRIDGLAKRADAALDIDLKTQNAAALFRILDIPIQSDPSLALKGRLDFHEGANSSLLLQAVDLGNVHLTGRIGLANPLAQGTTLELAMDSVPLDLLFGPTSSSRAMPRLERAQLSATLKDGIFDQGKISGTILGGALELTAGSSSKNTVPVALTINNADLGEGAAWLGSALLTGRADLRANLMLPASRGTGSPIVLSGTVEIAGTGGIIDGIDLAAMRQVLRNDDTPADIVALLGAGLDSGATPYRHLTSKGHFAAGTFQLDTLRIATDFGVIEGAFQANLDRPAIVGELLVPVVGEPMAPPLKIALGGEFDDPRVTLDFTKLQSYLLSRNAAHAQPAAGR